MNVDPVELDLIRARWRRRREAEALVDVDADEFGKGRLGRRLPELAARLLILPVDPEKYAVDFDSEIREWWKQDYMDPVRRVPTQWGRVHDSTSQALLTADAYDDTCEHYLALGHDGSVEAGLGDAAVDNDRFRGYLLTNLVYRVWLASARFSEAHERLSLDGPFELTLALRKTEGALLGDFGQGWAEPGELIGRPKLCREPALLLRREFEEWKADEDWVREVVYGIGGQLEDSWGTEVRRFFNERGDNAGEFAVERIRWQR